MNAWDDGYPSGGNYWSGCTLIDHMIGPSQDQTCPNGDDINDSAYAIATDNVDHYPLTKPFNQHDIGITSFQAKTVVGQGEPLHMRIGVVNYGIFGETFKLECHASLSMIASQTVWLPLAERNSTTLNLTWSTAGFARGSYALFANVTVLQGEIDTADNSFTYGVVRVSFVGDVNGDGKVRVDDVLAVAQRFGANLGGPPNGNGFYYDANCDINDDAKIRVDDVLATAQNFGQGS
jgi:hypothetical protein